MADSTGNTRITLIQSDEEVDPAKLGTRAQTVDLWVRTPDSERLEAVSLSARLCSCRSVCIAVIEDTPAS